MLLIKIVLKRVVLLEPSSMERAGSISIDRCDHGQGATIPDSFGGQSDDQGSVIWSARPGKPSPPAPLPGGLGGGRGPERSEVRSTKVNFNTVTRFGHRRRVPHKPSGVLVRQSSTATQVLG